MEFLGVGYQELLLIFVLMLVVVGPERLPGMAYQIGKAVRTLQSYARQVRDEFGDEISYIEDQYKTVRGEVDSARESLRSENARLTSELTAATEVLRTDPTAPASPVGASSVAVADVPVTSEGFPPAPDAAAPAEPQPDAPAPPPLLF